MAPYPKAHMDSDHEMELVVSGRLIKRVALRSEGWEFLDSPEDFLAGLRRSNPSEGDIFSFIERIDAASVALPYYFETEPIAALRIDTYDKWFRQQINSKTRNMIRKAGLKGVRIQVADFNDDLIHGIQEIQNESPVRQGMRFWHYGNNFETTRLGHATFLSRSRFIGAYLNDELIGYVKMVNNGNWMGIMQILSKYAHRDKAPTNALLAKSVEICAQEGVKFLSYGVWSTRSLGDFKIHHGFARMEIKRYFVPLTATGQLALRFRLHRSPRDYLPQSLKDYLALLRGKLYPPQTAEVPK